MYHLILLRHGQSQWNLENRFTGWTDVDLTEKGATRAPRPDGKSRPQVSSRDIASLRFRNGPSIRCRLRSTQWTAYGSPW